MGVLLEQLRTGRAERVVDLGCGMGWLSHRMAANGYCVYAVDILLDGVLGLGAAGILARRGAYFERIQGELERPPFQDSSIDVVVCNASFHYSRDETRSLLEIARILRPGGRFVLMNSPIHIDLESAARAQASYRAHLKRLGASEQVAGAYRHLSKAELIVRVNSLIGPVHQPNFEPGRLFRWVRRAKGLVLRMELASFPILIATKSQNGTE